MYLWKVDSLHKPSLFEEQNKVYVKFMKLAVVTFIIIEICLCTAVQFVGNKLNFPIQVRINWFGLYAVRLKVVCQEQLGALLCLEFQSRFRNLNVSLRDWRGVLDGINASKNNIFSRVTCLAAEFSNLTLALEDINEHFGLHWLLQISQLTAALIVVLARMESLDEFLPIATFLGFAIVISARLIFLCFLLGETSDQVSNCPFVIAI
jgi:hypothetical protein